MNAAKTILSLSLFLLMACAPTVEAVSGPPAAAVDVSATEYGKWPPPPPPPIPSTCKDMRLTAIGGDRYVDPDVTRWDASVPICSPAQTVAGRRCMPAVPVTTLYAASPRIGWFVPAQEVGSRVVAIPSKAGTVEFLLHANPVIATLTESREAFQYMGDDEWRIVNLPVGDYWVGTGFVDSGAYKADQMADCTVD